MSQTEIAERLVELGYLEEVLHSEEEIDETIGRIADELTEDYPDELPTLVGIKKGGVFFTEKLADALEERTGVRPTVLYLRTITRDGEESMGFFVPEDEDLSEEEIQQHIVDKDVVVADDVFDRGETLTGVIQIINARGARSARSAALTRKDVDRNEEVIDSPDYVGFDDPNRWLVGSGMNLDREPFREAFRGLGVIAVAAAIEDDPLLEEGHQPPKELSEFFYPEDSLAA